MQSTFRVKVIDLAKLQDLVKQHDLRFVGNPIIMQAEALVTLDGNQLSMEKCKAFFRAWMHVTAEIKEIPEKTRIQKFCKRVKQLFGQTR